MINNSFIAMNAACAMFTIIVKWKESKEWIHDLFTFNYSINIENILRTEKKLYFHLRLICCRLSMFCFNKKKIYNMTLCFGASICYILCSLSVIQIWTIERFRSEFFILFLRFETTFWPSASKTSWKVEDLLLIPASQLMAKYEVCIWIETSTTRQTLKKRKKEQFSFLFSNQETKL